MFTIEAPNTIPHKVQNCTSSVFKPTRSLAKYSVLTGVQGKEAQENFASALANTLRHKTSTLLFLLNTCENQMNISPINYARLKLI